MKRLVYKAALALSVMAGVSSCSLDEYNPSEVTGDETLATFAGWYGMQSKCYEPIYGQLYSTTDFLSVAEAGTDLWLTSNNSDNTKELYYYESLTPYANKPWDKLFMQAYSAIGNCNTVINRVSTVTDGEEASLKVLNAEAHFLRGFYHLILTTYYGPITLCENESGQNIVLAPQRNTLSEIYTSIISDLQYAAENLNKEPYGGNRARATKKSAMGLLARAYIQGAGQGLSENGISYWQRAAEVAEELISDTEGGGSQYGAYLYDDIADMWADTNNRNNKEALFTAAGCDAGDSDAFYYSASNKLFIYPYWNQANLSDISKITSDKQNYFYGRTNSGVCAPSKYLLDCFDPSWDKRWENSFQTAFGGFSMEQPQWLPYAKQIVTLTDALCTKYGIDPAMSGSSLYPYADCNAVTYQYGGNQYEASIWPKGETNGDVSKLIKPQKAYVVDYPIAKDDNRFFLYISKEYLTEEDKKGRPYACVNLDDLFDNDGNYVKTQNDMPASYDRTSKLYTVYPCLNKFICSYNGVYNGSNLQVRNSDVFIMRTAEVYLIAAEAEQHLGNGAKAATYLNKLRARAARTGVAASTYELTNATEDDIFDEYARELCGEFSRWSLLQRHQAFESRLAQYNKRAASSFKPYAIWRPMSQTFLQQIENAEEYGDNGYGTTAKSGLDGFLK